MILIRLLYPTFYYTSHEYEWEIEGGGRNGTWRKCHRSVELTTNPLTYFSYLSQSQGPIEGLHSSVVGSICVFSLQIWVKIYDNILRNVCVDTKLELTIWISINLYLILKRLRRYESHMVFFSKNFHSIGHVFMPLSCLYKIVTGTTTTKLPFFFFQFMKQFNFGYPKRLYYFLFFLITS